jgi:hypothetical protein
MTVKIDGTNTEANPAFTGADTDTGLQCGSNEVKLVTGGSTRATVDSAGRFGIGTSAPDDTLHLDGSTGHGLKLTDNNSHTFVVRTHSDGGIIKTASNHALLFGTNDTEHARFDSTGRLLVNKTGSPTTGEGSEAPVFIQGNTTNASGPAVLGLARGQSASEMSTGASLGIITFTDDAGNDFAEIKGACDGGAGNNDHPGRLSILTTPNSSSSPTERFRINKRGYVKAGTRITHSTNGVADLDSARHEFTSDDNGWTMIVTHNSGAASEHEGILINYRNSPNNSGNSYLQGNDSNGTRFRVSSNGGLHYYHNNSSNLSDQREKKNIVNLETKWDKVKSWDIKKFHYNEDDDNDDLRYGVIAQQVEEHCPEVLTDWVKQSAQDAVLDEDGNVVTPAVAEVIRKGVKEQQMMWMAIKALQEAQTRIESLETQNTAQQAQINDLLARVTALEAAE